MKKFVVRLVLILLILALVVGTLFGLIYFVNEYSTPQLYSEQVYKYSFLYGVDCNLVYAVMKAESSFDEFSISQRGACGLMQLMPSTAEFVAQQLGEKGGYDLFDPETNIRFGTWYLSYLSYKFDSQVNVLIAYNAGEGTLRSWLRRFGDEKGRLSTIPYPETKRYVKNVLRYFELYREHYHY